VSKKLIFVIFFAAISLSIYSQRSSMELTFTAVDSAAYVQLDSIKIMNRSQGGDTVLYYPDTVLSIYYLGVPELSGEHTDFQVFQNYPNPMTDKTTISLFVPEKDRVHLVVTDMLGRVILKTERELEKGIQSFLFMPGSENLYCFTARWRGNISSIKILCASSYLAGKGSLEYSGSEPSSPKLKLSETLQDFNFSPGDELLYTGYAGGIESGLLDIPEESRTYIIQFATNIPCPGTPTVEYEGQVYNTIQIFGQCWLQENLNVGTMIPGTMEPSNNGTNEKYS
jgi:hypothetical protein